MSTRTARRPAEPDMAAMTPRDRLILAQAVYELGDDWSSIAKLLSKHPLLSHPKSFFTAQSCQSIYANLLQEAGLDLTEANATIHAAVNLALARRFYATHFDELRKLILVEEAKFKAIAEEIEQLRAGTWKKPEPRTEEPDNGPFTEEQPKASDEQDTAGGADEDDESSEDEPLHATRSEDHRLSDASVTHTYAARAARLRASTTTKPKDRKKGRSSAPDSSDVEMERMDTPAGDEESPAPEFPARRSKRKASVLDPPDSIRDKKRLREVSEPLNEEEAGSSNPEAIAIKRFQSIIGPLHSRITTLKDGNIFQSPIKASEAPDYRDIVKRPTDLRTIKNKIKEGAITNSLEYRRDIYLMFANAIMYNRPGSSVSRMAETMRDDSEVLVNDFRNTEAALMMH
ncbi:Bromodomain-containing protein, partial [Hymenopellis radicata]